MTLEDLTLDMIVSAYSGRKGWKTCACGCMGKWRYTWGHQAEGGRARGYPVDPDEVSDRGVARVLSNARKAAATLVEYSERYGTLRVETSDRLYIFTTTRSAG